jgi:hypothetical protein
VSTRVDDLEVRAGWPQQRMDTGSGGSPARGAVLGTTTGAAPAGRGQPRRLERSDAVGAAARGARGGGSPLGMRNGPGCAGTGCLSASGQLSRERLRAPKPRQSLARRPTQHAAARRTGPSSHERRRSRLSSCPRVRCAAPTVKDTAAARRQGLPPLDPASCACGPRQGQAPDTPGGPPAGVCLAPPPKCGWGGQTNPRTTLLPRRFAPRGRRCGGRLAAPKSDPPRREERAPWVPVRVRHHHQGPAPGPPGPAGSSRLPPRKKRAVGPCDFDCSAAARGRRSQPPWTPGGPLCPLRSHSRPTTRATP